MCKQATFLEHAVVPPKKYLNHAAIIDTGATGHISTMRPNNTAHTSNTPALDHPWESTSRCIQARTRPTSQRTFNQSESRAHLRRPPIRITHLHRPVVWRWLCRPVHEIWRKNLQEWKGNYRRTTQVLPQALVTCCLWNQWPILWLDREHGYWLHRGYWSSLLYCLEGSADKGGGCWVCQEAAHAFDFHGRFCGWRKFREHVLLLPLFQIIPAMAWSDWHKSHLGFLLLYCLLSVLCSTALAGTRWGVSHLDRHLSALAGPFTVTVSEEYKSQLNVWFEHSHTKMLLNFASRRHQTFDMLEAVKGIECELCCAVQYGFKICGALNWKRCRWKS